MRVEPQWVDWWTVVHFSSGFVASKFGVSEPVALAGAVLYELVEQPVLRSQAGRRFFGASGPEVIPNQIIDVLIFWAGYRLATRSKP